MDVQLFITRNYKHDILPHRYSLIKETFFKSTYSKYFFVESLTKTCYLRLCLKIDYFMSELHQNMFVMVSIIRILYIAAFFSSSSSTTTDPTLRRSSISISTLFGNLLVQYFVQLKIWIFQTQNLPLTITSICALRPVDPF